MEKRQRNPFTTSSEGKWMGGGRGGGSPPGVDGKGIFRTVQLQLSQIHAWQIMCCVFNLRFLQTYRSYSYWAIAQGSSLGQAGGHFSVYRTVRGSPRIMDVTLDGLFHFSHIPLLPLQRYVAETFNEMPYAEGSYVELRFVTRTFNRCPNKLTPSASSSIL
jgi:hypothetical protein